MRWVTYYWMEGGKTGRGAVSVCLCCVCVQSYLARLDLGSIICLLPSNQEQWYLGIEQRLGTLGGGGVQRKAWMSVGADRQLELARRILFSLYAWAGWRSGTPWHASVPVTDSARLLCGLRETSYLGAFVSQLVH